MGGKAGGGKVDKLGLGVSLATINIHKVTFYLSILTTHCIIIEAKQAKAAKQGLPQDA